MSITERDSRTAANPATRVVRELFEAFNTRDLTGALKITHPDLVLLPITAVVVRDGRPYAGHVGLAEYLNDVDRYWQELVAAPDEVRAAVGAVIATGRTYGRGWRGGAFDAATTWIVKLASDERVIRVQVVSDERQALRAIGLDEPATRPARRR
jgi:ketosteroid isomerase-like protein